MPVCSWTGAEADAVRSSLRGPGTQYGADRGAERREAPGDSGKAADHFQRAGEIYG